VVDVQVFSRRAVNARVAVYGGACADLRGAVSAFCVALASAATVVVGFSGPWVSFVPSIDPLFKLLAICRVVAAVARLAGRCEAVPSGPVT